MKLKVIIVSILLLISNLYAHDVCKEVFTHIYDHGVWGRNAEGEAFSGGGSFFHTTVEYRNFLISFLKNKNIKTVVDIGCGDWEFSRFISWNDMHIQYIGYDIVESVIEKDIVRYGSPTIRFVVGNFLEIDLPPADLLLCKHVLQHLSNADIMKLIPQFKKYKYCLITNETDRKSLSSNNPDIEVGDCRALDLTKPPFNVNGKKVLTYIPKNEFGVHQVLLIEN